MVLGASGVVGSAMVQMAEKVMGCRVLRVGRGSGSGIDVDSVSEPQLSGAKTLTGGKGPDVIIDTVGDAKLVRASLSVLAPRGRLSFITAPRGSEGSVVGVDFLEVYRKEAELVGCNSVGDYSPEVLAEMLRGMVEDFEAGKLTIKEVEVKGIVSLEDAVEAYGKKGRWTIVMDQRDVGCCCC